MIRTDRDLLSSHGRAPRDGVAVGLDALGIYGTFISSGWITSRKDTAILRLIPPKTVGYIGAILRTAPIAPTLALHRAITGNLDMLDVIFVIGGLAFFAISIGYTAVCERL